MEERYLVYTLPIDGQQWDQLCFPFNCMDADSIYISYKLVKAQLVAQLDLKILVGGGDPLQASVNMLASVATSNLQLRAFFCTVYFLYMLVECRK